MKSNQNLLRLVFGITSALCVALASINVNADAVHKARSAQLAQAKALFKAENMNTGRILVLIPKPDKKRGQPIAGAKGFHKVGKKVLRESDFDNASQAVVFEKHASGKITMRQVLIERRNGKTAIYDEALSAHNRHNQGGRQNMPNRQVEQKKFVQAKGGGKHSELARATSSSAASASEYEGSVISSETHVEAAPQVVSDPIVVNDTPQSLDDEEQTAESEFLERVKAWREKKAQEQDDASSDIVQDYIEVIGVDLVVEGDPEVANEWQAIKVEGEDLCNPRTVSSTTAGRFGALGASVIECDSLSYVAAYYVGKGSCEKAYPATAELQTAFRHGLTEACYSCPKDFDRSLADIKASDACTRAIPAKTLKEKAEYLGKVSNSKPKGAFFDPRKGGEYWRCPDNRPRRTANAVTSDKACATESMINEKLAGAIFVTKKTNPKPKGAFEDPRNGGEYWKCPNGFSRSASAVDKSDACVKSTAASTEKKHATFRGDQRMGCPIGSFEHGLSGNCFKCPAGYVRPGRLRAVNRNR